MIDIDIDAAAAYIEKQLKKSIGNLKQSNQRGDKNAVAGLESKINHYNTILFALYFYKDLMDEYSQLPKKMNVQFVKTVKDVDPLMPFVRSTEDTSAKVAEEIPDC